MDNADRLPLEPTSWWWEDAIAAEGGELDCPPLQGRQEVDVAIVGGGFTGLWTALALSERSPNLRIALIEAKRCGSGASGKNGGKVHGYWASLGSMADNLGADGALAVARAGTRAQDGMRAFAQSPGVDVWWRESGNMRVATVPAQEARLDRYIAAAQRLGAPDTAVRLSVQEVRARCDSSAFRSGVYFPEGANVHPARLARALRKAVLARGVTIYEHTPMSGVEPGQPNRVSTPNGELLARDVVLATNAALATHPAIKAHLCVFSSYACMSESDPQAIERQGWRTEDGLADMRMFLHYFRKTTDGRILMGSGSGPIAYGGRADDPAMTGDLASAQRAVSGLRRLLPAMAQTGIARVWGGAIDMTSDRLPFFRTLPGTRVHYGCGYSGHGVNPTYIGGQCLASLVLGVKDEWSTLPLCTRELPSFPPEPWRTLGGRAIRWGVMQCEAAEDNQQSASALARMLADLPRRFGLKVGTR
jgi:glycine/D-amino acid oxidase-like deaminating enzyme